jgi:predicted nucleic acid-binding protein
LSPAEAFWDSSALTPLCAEQSTSDHARALLPQFPPAVWWSASVEIRSAVERLYRSGDLDHDSKLLALARLYELSRNWDEVQPSDAVRDRAKALLDIYPLRAADGLQLAAALVWCRNRPAGRTFLCADRRLSEAATRAGFTVVVPDSA